MKSLPLITILMPCYNALPYLSEALESIINQTYTNLDILCINDGSTDGTGKLLEEYAKKDKRIRVVHNKENIKLIKTLNKGIDLAQGEYIARMDADDISHLERLEILLQESLKLDSDVISSGWSMIDEKGELQYTHIPLCSQPNAIAYMSFFVTPLNHAGSTFKTNILREIKYKDEIDYTHVEDYCLWTELIYQKKNLSNLKRPLYYIRKNYESVSHKYEDIQKNNFFQTLKEHHDRMGFPCSIRVAKVVGLRMDKMISVNDFKLALKHKNHITNSYLKKANEFEKKEIIKFNKYITLSIILQAIKRCSFGLKIFAVLTFVKSPTFNLSIWKLILKR